MERRISQRGELRLIQEIRRRFQPRRSEIIRSIGDDCAVLDKTSRKILITTDTLNEGIHFDRSYTCPYSLGFKTVSVNVSDIYATGGEPVAIFLSLSLPKDLEEEFFDDFYEGINYGLKAYNIDLLGGDLCASQYDISICATLLGYTDNPIYRSGAKEGDLVCVTGFIGESAMGLRILQSLNRSHKDCFRKTKYLEQLSEEVFEVIKNGQHLILKGQSIKPLINRHLMPTARRGDEIYKGATSMIDISDGLYIDLQRICEESKVGAKIYTCKIPISREMTEQAKLLGLDALSLAVSGGEDFELLFTFPRTKPLPQHTEYPITVIGEIVSDGITFIDEQGNVIEFDHIGYEHFTE